MVIPVGDVDGAAGGDRHPGWVVELGGVAGAVGKPGGAASGEGGDGAGGGVDGPDPVVVGVGETVPPGATATPAVALNWAVLPGPSANPAVPLPARVVTAPVVGLMARIRWLFRSAT